MRGAKLGLVVEVAHDPVVLVEEEVLVDVVEVIQRGDDLAQLLILKHGLAQVEDPALHGRRPRQREGLLDDIALLEIVASQALQHISRQPAQVIEVAALQGLDLREIVVVDLELDATPVHVALAVRQAVSPVVIAPAVGDRLAQHVRLHLVRPAADGRHVVEVPAQALARSAVHVLWIDGEIGDPDRQIAPVLPEEDFHGVPVGLHQPVDTLPEDPGGGVHVRIEEQVVGEDDVVGRHRLAVGEAGLRPQSDGHGLPVVGDLEVLREQSIHRERLVVVPRLDAQGLKAVAEVGSRLSRQAEGRQFGEVLSGQPKRPRDRRLRVQVLERLAFLVLEGGRSEDGDAVHLLPGMGAGMKAGNQAEHRARGQPQVSSHRNSRASLSIARMLAGGTSARTLWTCWKM
jgi:hypothetical protein